VFYEIVQSVGAYFFLMACFARHLATPQSTPSRNTHKFRENTPTLVQERAITLTDRDMRENGATVW
jgi:hypothetical protein